MRRRLPLPVPLLLPLLIAANVHADPTELDTVVVVASRRAEPVAQAAANVDVVEREQIEQRLAQDSADLVRYLPGLRVDGEANRFGNQGYSIRGLGGNRVRVEVDGVPLPETFAVGQFASASRDLAELEAIERIEVLRGPASTLYGSDALAGIVAIHSRSPEELLASGSDDRVLATRFGWSSRDRSRLYSLAWAQQDEDGNAGLLLVGQRDGHELENNPRDPRFAANPAQSQRRGLLGRWQGEHASLGQWQLLLDSSRGERQTDVVSQRFGPGRFSTTTLLLADDSYRRDRLSLGSRWQGQDALNTEFSLLAYVQDSEVVQDTDQYRNADRTTPFASLRQRRFEFGQRSLGVDALANGQFEALGARHWLVYGLDLERHRYRGQRDGVEINLASGVARGDILGEVFPVRDFPTSVSDRLGAFVQDEIRWGRLALIPGLRWEYSRLDARPDAMYREDYPEAVVVDDRARSLTGKLGLRWDLGERSQAFLQYAQGFRAPPFSDLNIGLSLTLLNYEVRPNPDLKDETSHGLDLGWRWQGDWLDFSIAGYDNRYRNLIESRANLGVDPATGALVFQSVNRQRARIRGIEAELDWRLGGLQEAWQDWTLHAALARSRGDDQSRGQPLNSIDPDRAVLGLRYDPTAGDWGGELLLTATARQDRLDASAGALFEAPGHGRLDLFGWWRINDQAQLNLGLFNLGDRRYWDWASVRGLPANTGNLDFYTGAGRQLSLSLNLRF